MEIFSVYSQAAYYPVKSNQNWKFTENKEHGKSGKIDTSMNENHFTSRLQEVERLPVYSKVYVDLYSA